MGQKPHPKTLPLIPSAFSVLDLTLEDMWDIFRKQAGIKKVQSTLPKSRLLSSKVTADRTRTRTGLTGSPKLLVYSSIYQTRTSLQKGVLRPTCQRTLQPTFLKTRQQIRKSDPDYTPCLGFVLGPDHFDIFPKPAPSRRHAEHPKPHFWNSAPAYFFINSLEDMCSRSNAEPLPAAPQSIVSAKWQRPLINYCRTSFL